MIAPYISESEYRCQHCGQLPPDLIADKDGNWPLPYGLLFGKFQIIREQWGKPIVITSGYRCVAHELEVSGHELTVHVFGLALDLATGSVEGTNQLNDFVVKIYPELRIGTNFKNFHLHIDVGYAISPRWSANLAKGARWDE